MEGEEVLDIMHGRSRMTIRGGQEELGVSGFLVRGFEEFVRRSFLVGSYPPISRRLSAQNKNKTKESRYGM